eukprot:COSAG05_NODE_358_length_10812_cov_90.986372_9_plen_52_part_00
MQLEQPKSGRKKKMTSGSKVLVFGPSATNLRQFDEGRKTVPTLSSLCFYCF